MKFLNEYKQIKNNYRFLSLVEKFIIWTRFKTNPVDLILKLIPSCGRILDLGCGFGVFSYLFAFKYPNATIISIDPSKDRIELAEDVFLKPKNLRFHLGKIGNLVEGNFDSIMLIDTIYLLSEEELINTLKMCHEKTKQGGTLIIKTMNKNRFFRSLLTILVPLLFNGVISLSSLLPNKMRKVIAKIFGLRGKRSKFYRAEELKSVLEREKWQVVGIYDLPLWCFPWYPNIVYFCKKN